MTYFDLEIETLLDKIGEIRSDIEFAKKPTIEHSNNIMSMDDGLIQAEAHLQRALTWAKKFHGETDVAPV